jgi:hypothetical protein
MGWTDHALLIWDDDKYLQKLIIKLKARDEGDLAGLLAVSV